jgi:hypothetical protein
MGESLNEMVIELWIVMNEPEENPARSLPQGGENEN